MSEFSRETPLNIIETDHVQCGEASALARMALAAMDSSESVELPLDYLQGHKDGLEWAARLAEANHPDTGDWLYDDPIELAKAIRKGPDMPPVQPVEDSDPDRNPVLAYADSYRDMAKQGVESVPIWSVITDIERNIAPLYLHAQPAPVVPEEWTIADAVKFCKETGRQDAGAAMDAWNACRAAMLQELKKSAGTETTCRSNENAQVLTSINPAPDLVSLPKNAKSLTGNSPVIPDGYVMVPKEPTESMVIAGFESEPDEFFSESEVWEAYQKMSGCEQAAFRARLCWTAMLAAAPQEVKGE
ncbi:DUF551 domain-containing protein [Klebsiella pneumoniae]|uniref:DUF551 domain-containing protein n=1 Tax=Klebsiella pneumoniae TaxID=573 RepID=UPI000E2CE442|nr:DUF551 domain-containing protein [Klebsiella pneumoniae]SXM05888.1 Uncharacterised protein [Klebsiella pneumoniae]